MNKCKICDCDLIGSECKKEKHYYNSGEDFVYESFQYKNHTIIFYKLPNDLCQFFYCIEGKSFYYMTMKKEEFFSLPYKNEELIVRKLNNILLFI